MAAAFVFETARKEFRNKVDHHKKDADLQVLVNYFKSYSGNDNEKKSVMDQAFKDLSRSVVDENSENVVDNVLSIVNVCIFMAKKGHCTMNIPFVIMADVLDYMTLEDCDEIFSYMESKVSVWKVPAFYAAGKNFLLRMCNDLLRRLSQSRNTVFCGRIQLFLACLFPLDEKSALNLFSQFNTDNKTEYEKSDNKSNDKDDENAMDVDDQLNSSIIDHKLYECIWSLQDIFRQPIQCYNADMWKKFTENSDEVLRVLASHKIEAVSSNASHPNKHKNNKKSYFAKFLTSKTLSDLQLNDHMFRRQIYIQFLILFRYLQGQSRFKQHNRQTLVLTDAQKKWIGESEGKIYNLLEETPPDGKKFASYVKHMLAREEFWVQWKNKNCQSFMKPPASAAEEPSGEPAAKKSRKTRSRSTIGDDFINDRPLGLGSAELTRLWSICPDNKAACQADNRMYLPTLKDFFQDSYDQEDPVNEIEDQYKSTRDPKFQWKGLRLLSKRSYHFFTLQPVNQQFKKMAEYLTNIITTKIDSEFTKPVKVEETSMDVSANDTNNESNADVTIADDGNGEDEFKEVEENLQDSKNQEALTTNGQASDEVPSDLIDSVATKVAESWKKMAQSLKLTEKDIKEIEGDSDDNVMRARQCLCTWQDFNDKKATKNLLSTSLSRCGLDDAAKLLK